MTNLGAWLGLLFLLVHAGLAPILFGLAVARPLRLPRADVAAWVLYGLGLWSGLTAVVLDLALRFAPHHSRGLYVGLYTVLLVAVAIGATHAIRGWAREDRPLRFGLGPATTAWRRLGLPEKAAVAAVVICVAFFVVQNLAQPLTGNDAIVHTIVAKLIVRDLSTAGYPFAQPDPQTGFLLEGCHPLGFSMSKALFMLVLGDPDTPWHKPLTAVYFGYLLIAVALVAARIFGRRAAVYAAALTAFTPLMLHSVAIVHIDPLRVYAFFLCFAILTEYLRRPHPAWLCYGALALIVCLHVHAGNVLVLGFLGPLFLALAPGSLISRLLRGLAIMLPAILIVSPQFITNLHLYGSLMGTDYALERSGAIPFHEWTQLQRSLTSLSDILLFGAFAPFSDLTWFGPVFWLATGGVAMLIFRRQWRRPGIQVIFGSLLIYAAMVAVGVAARKTEFYMNTRYTMIMLPFAAVLGGGFTQQAFIWARWTCLPRRGGTQIKAGVIVAAAVFTGFGLLLIWPIMQWIEAFLARRLDHAVQGGPRSIAFLLLLLLFAVMAQQFATSQASWVIALRKWGFRLCWRRLAGRSGSSFEAFSDQLGVSETLAITRRVFRSALALALARSSPRKYHPRIAYSIITGATLSSVAIPLLLCFAYYWLAYLSQLATWRYFSPSAIALSDLQKIGDGRDLPGAISYLGPAVATRRFADKGKAIMTFRDSEVYYYGKGLILSQYDHRLWDLYKLETAKEALDYLRARNIGAIYAPNYSSPTTTGNGLGSLLLQPQHLRLIDNDVNSLFQLVGESRHLTTRVIMSASPDKPVALAADAWHLEPRGLDVCERLHEVHVGVVSWYVSVLRRYEQRASCATAYGNRNWVLLGQTDPHAEFRLKAQLGPPGCVQMRAMFRVPVAPDLYNLPTVDYAYYAVRANETAEVTFKRPPGADAMAIGFYADCTVPTTVKSYLVDESVEQDSVALGRRSP